MAVPQSVAKKVAFKGPLSVRITEAEWAASTYRRLFDAASRNDPEDKIGDIAYSIMKANEVAEEFGIPQSDVRAFIRGERNHI